MKPSFVGGSEGGEVPDFKLLFESISGLYLVLDLQFNIAAVSEEYLKATMTKREEIIGRGLFQVFPDNPDDPEANGESNLKASLERVKSRKVADTMAIQKYDIRRPESEGGGFEVRYWSPVNSPIFDANNNLVYIMHRAEDVTEFVNLQQIGTEQREKNADLEMRTVQMQAEILLRSKELQEVNRQLRLADQAKSEFLSRMSHELRTPLNAVLGFGQLLQSANLEAEHNEWVNTMMKAGKHLLALMNDALDISRVEAGNLSLSIEPVALSDVVEEAIDFVTPLANRNSIRIKKPAIPQGFRYVRGDRQRLSQVFINILSNAVKYNKKDGEVDISIESRDGKIARIEISDTGYGIPQEDLEKLFIPFERLTAIEKGIEGTGLGLSLCRMLLDAMDGAISVTSTLGKGSSFFVEIPSIEPIAVDELVNERDSKLEIYSYAKPKTVLYVEDVVANLRLVGEIFKRRPNVTLVSAMLGELAVDLAREHKPDMVLLDVHLPDIGGEEVLSRLKLIPAMANVPIVMLSADASPKQIERFIGSGAYAYLTKPISVRGLLEAADEILDESTVDLTDQTIQRTL